MNDWSLPRSSQIYPALIIPFYIPFYISPIRWILYYIDIPIFPRYIPFYVSPRYPQDIPNFTRKSAGLGSWDHRSSQRFGDFAGQGYSVTPDGIPQKQYWLVVMLCVFVIYVRLFYIYIYVLVVFRYVIWFCNWGFIWGCNMVFVPSWEDDPSWLVFGWNHQPDKFSQLSYCWWWLNWLNNYRMNVAKRCLTMPFAKIMRLKIECHGVKHL